jgi:hypothetical protein
MVYLCGRVHLTRDDTCSRPDVHHLNCCLNVGHNTVGLKNVTLNVDITDISKTFLFSWSAVRLNPLALQHIVTTLDYT